MKRDRQAYSARSSGLQYAMLRRCLLEGGSPPKWTLTESRQEVSLVVAAPTCRINLNLSSLSSHYCYWNIIHMACTYRVNIITLTGVILSCGSSTSMFSTSLKQLYSQAPQQKRTLSLPWQRTSQNFTTAAYWCYHDNFYHCAPATEHDLFYRLLCTTFSHTFPQQCTFPNMPS